MKRWALLIFYIHYKYISEVIYNLQNLLWYHQPLLSRRPYVPLCVMIELGEPRVANLGDKIC